jgi:hypothetical protein
MVQKIICGTLNYMTWELLDPQLHHMGTSGPSITPHGNFWTINYTTSELLVCGVIYGSEDHLRCN